MHDATTSRISFQPLLFTKSDFPGMFFDDPDSQEMRFKSAWDVIVSLLSPEARLLLERENAGRGRHNHTLLSILGILAAKDFFRMPTMKDTLRAVRWNTNVRTVIGLDRMPGESVVSRGLGRIREILDIQDLFARLVTSYHAGEGHLVDNLSIDSTIIENREKPAAREKPQEPEEKKKKGKPKKGSPEEVALEERKLLQEKEMEAYVAEEPEDSVSRLNMRCSVTGKRNSKGKTQYFVGYKAHLAVDDWGIPAAYVVTGAGVHDSKVALPLLKMAEKRCVFLYDLMDGGYSSGLIDSYSRSIGKVPVIDFKAPRGHEKPEMDKAKKIRYRARTTVERTNSELKGMFIPGKLYYRDAAARFEISLTVLLETIKRISMVLEKKRKAKAA